MTRVFISYRRDDSAAYAGRLYDRLTAHFGQDQVFMDIDQIGPGEDFVETIQRTVSASETTVVLIGKGWLSATDADGKRRLDDPDDFVRLEIATALERKIKVVPVLVGGAAMPKTSQLPESLALLARRNAIEISDTRFHSDVNRLIEAIEKIRAGVQAPIASAESSNVDHATRSGHADSTTETVDISSSARSPRASSPEPAVRSEIPKPVPEPHALKPPGELLPMADQGLKGKPSETRRQRIVGGIGAVLAFTTIGLMMVFRSPEPKREPSEQLSRAGEAEPSGKAAAAAYVGVLVKIRGQDTFPPGDGRSVALRVVAKTLGDVSSERIQLDVLPSGSVFKASESLDAVARGAADAAWVSASYFSGKSPAFALIDGPPFGPSPTKYVQWRQDPGVKASVEEIYRKFGVSGLLCAVTGPNVDLWSRKRIDRPSDLKGLKTRAVGLNSEILTAAGAAVVGLPAGEIYPALSQGKLDAIQLSELTLGGALGLPSVAKHVYFPGRMAAAAGVDLIVNAGVWDGLTAEARAVIESACERNVQAMLGASDAENRAAVISMASKGVTIESLPVPVLAHLRTAWMKVAADKSTDLSFSRLFALTPSPAKTE